MGNASSKEHEGYGYGYDNGFIPQRPDPYGRQYQYDPYSLRKPRRATLPPPPKEPVPAPPQWWGGGTPYHLPRHLREEQEEEQPRRKNSILKAAGRFLNGGGGPGESSSSRQNPNPFTYPDGRRFPQKAVMSPHRPAGGMPLGRMWSYPEETSRRNNKKKRNGRRPVFPDDIVDDRYAAEYYQDWDRGRVVKQQPAWRERLPNPFLRRASMDEERESGLVSIMAGHRGGGGRSGGDAYTDGQGRTIKVKAATNENYVPVTQMNRNWTLPDGSPFPNLNNIPPTDIPAPTAQQAAAAGVGVAAILRSNSPEGPPVIPPGIPVPSAVPGPSIIPNPIPAPPQPYDLPDEVADPRITFCFDRKHDFCHYSYKHPINYDRKMYPTAYHLWEAMKYMEARPDAARRIRKCQTVKDVQKLVSELGTQGVRPDWGEVAIKKMEEALHTQFIQHTDVLTEFLATGNRNFVFLSKREPYWGFSLPTASGENKLGRCLESVRAKMIEQKIPEMLDRQMRNPTTS